MSRLLEDLIKKAVGAALIGAAGYLASKKWVEKREELVPRALDWAEKNYGLKARSSIDKAIVTFDKGASGIYQTVTLVRKTLFGQKEYVYTAPKGISIDESIRKRVEAGETVVEEYILK